MHFDSVDVCKATYIHEDGRTLNCSSVLLPHSTHIYARSFHDSINMRGSIVNGNSSGGIVLSGSSLSVTVLDTSLVHLMLIQVRSPVYHKIAYI